MTPTDRNDTRIALSRRTLLKAAPLALAAPFVLRATGSQAADSLVFATWGGTYREGIAKTLIEPFTKETGINVTVVEGPDLARVKAQLLTGNVEWDIFDGVGATSAAGSKQGYWEPLDLSALPLNELSVAPTADLAPFFTFAGGLAWGPDRHPAGKHPATFADFFNVEAFPGRRALRNRVSETLEAALLADGVKPADMYPLDVDRAFRVLDRIKPHITKWVDATAQTVSLVQSKEVDFSYTYASRVKTATAAGGPPVDFSFAQTLNQVEYLSILRGSPRKAEAMKFIAFALSKTAQANTMEVISNSPVNKNALPLMSPAAVKWLPDMTLPQNLLINDAYWADNYEALTTRFREWSLL